MKRTGSRFEVAVFPLANAVLFPGTTLPLKIIEDRYWKMLEDVQARGWPLAVSLVTPSNGEEVVLNSICGAGEVHFAGQEEKKSEGAPEILVHGNQRIRLCRIIQQEPYLIMEAETVEPENTVDTLSGEGFEELRALVKTWTFINPDIPEHISLMFDNFETLSELTDFFVFHFIKSPREQQLYLDCNSPVQRAEMLSDFLEQDLLKLSRKLTKKRKTMVLH